MIAIEGLDDSDLSEDLASPADHTCLRILEHEDVQVGFLPFLLARKRSPRPFELGHQSAAVGGQVGEAAAGQLGHLIDGAEILAGRRADTKAHAAPPRRKMVSALNAARWARLAVIRYSS